MLRGCEPVAKACDLLQELPCGHFMHSHCFAQYTRYNYTCPLCAKSLGDMSVYFRMIDTLVEHDCASLPGPYKDRQQVWLNASPQRVHD